MGLTTCGCERRSPTVPPISGINDVEHVVQQHNGPLAIRDRWRSEFPKGIPIFYENDGKNILLFTLQHCRWVFYPSMFQLTPETVANC